MTEATCSPSREIRNAAPDLARLADDLNVILQPAMLAGHLDERGLAEAGWMLAKALRFLAAAAQAADPASLDEALSEVDTDALAAAGHARSVRGIAAAPEKLAAAGEASRQSDFDLGDPIATAATVRLLSLDDDSAEGAAHDEVTAHLDAHGKTRWTSARYGQLRVDGRAQLDLDAALDGVASAYADRPWQELSIATRSYLSCTTAGQVVSQPASPTFFDSPSAGGYWTGDLCPGRRRERQAG